MSEKGKETQWKEYKELEPIRRLRNEGRELLGQFIDVTEKRDGENVSIWLDNNNEFHVSSHHMEVADSHIVSRLKQTPEWSKIQDLLLTEKTQYNNDFIVFGELLKCVSPTRIEPNKKYTHWVMFDIYSIYEERYLGYNIMYQHAYGYKIPIVKLLDNICPKSIEELESSIDKWLKWCKRHRREGIVIKDYRNQVFAKHKINIPKRPKIDKPNKSDIQYPPMPEEKILRALQHAYDECGATEEKWKNKRITMPLVAKHFKVEAQEHNYSVPNNIYEIYVNTDIKLVMVSHPKTETFRVKASEIYPELTKVTEKDIADCWV